MLKWRLLYLHRRKFKKSGNCTMIAEAFIRFRGNHRRIPVFPDFTSAPYTRNWFSVPCIRVFFHTVSMSDSIMFWLTYTQFVLAEKRLSSMVSPHIFYGGSARSEWRQNLLTKCFLGHTRTDLERKGEKRWRYPQNSGSSENTVGGMLIEYNEEKKM